MQENKDDEAVVYVDKMWIERLDFIKKHDIPIGKLFWKYNPNENTIPLWQIKEISTEEISKLAEYHGIDCLYEGGIHQFARALESKIKGKKDAGKQK